MSLIQNERTKLRASTLNSVVVAAIIAGFITPLAAVAFGVPGAGGRGPTETVVAALAFLVVGLPPTLACDPILGKPRRMTGGELFLLFLGPALALAAGLIIYGLGVYGADGRRGG